MNNASPAHAFGPDWGNELVRGLAETPAPERVSWLPETTGWLFLAALFAAWLLYRLYRWYKGYLADAYRRAALVELDKLQHGPDQQRMLPALLKRTALYAYERREVSRLTGYDWERWLDQQCPGCRFSTQFQGMLGQLAYRPDTALNDELFTGLRRQVATWIKQHRRRA